MPKRGPSAPKSIFLCPEPTQIGDRIGGTLGDIDPLNKGPVEESQKRVQKPLSYLGQQPEIFPKPSVWRSEHSKPGVSSQTLVF